MAKLKGLVSIVSELRTERINVANQLKHVDEALSVLSNLDGGNSYTKPRRTLSASARRRISLAQKARWAKRAGANGQAPRAKRTISAPGRRRIAAAQRARWAKLRKSPQPVAAGNTSGAGTPKRHMSASARRKIAAAQRARWKKVKANAA